MTSTPTPLAFAQLGPTMKQTYLQIWQLKASRTEMADISTVFCGIALRTGLRAALNRLLPDGYATASVRQPDGEWHESKIGNLRISRFRAYGQGTHEAKFLVTGNHGSPEADQFDILLDTKVGLITPGPWLQTLQDAANKKPEHRHESPAAFQRYLRATP
jgi:hypothetical protein